MPCVRNQKDESKRDKYYYTHNTPVTKAVEIPTTYDAIEASQPQQQQDIDYEPVEVPKDKHVSVDNSVAGDKYLNLVHKPTPYENVSITSEANTSDQKDKPKPNPKPKPRPQLKKELSTDSYTEMYSYTAKASPVINSHGATSSLALDATVPPPADDHSGNNNPDNNLYYNQDAILKSKSKQAHDDDDNEAVYCNQSAFIHGQQ